MGCIFILTTIFITYKKCIIYKKNNICILHHDGKMKIASIFYHPISSNTKVRLSLSLYQFVYYLCLLFIYLYLFSLFLSSSVLLSYKSLEFLPPSRYSTARIYRSWTIFFHSCTTSVVIFSSTYSVVVCFCALFLPISILVFLFFTTLIISTLLIIYLNHCIL